MKRTTNPLKNFFSKDIHIKILSLIVAVAAWFLVMNTISPVELKVFSVPVKLVNSKELMEKGYIISNREDFDGINVDIGVESTRPSLDELSKDENRSAMSANLDLSTIKINENEEFPQTFIVNVQPSLPSYLYAHTYTVTSYSPAYIAVQIDKMSTISHSVTVVTNGSPASDYELDTPVLSQDTVEINGPESKMDRVSEVIVNIDVSNSSEDLTVTTSPVVYDSEGNELHDFVTVPSNITVSCSIHKKDSININKPNTTGVLPPYLELSSIDWSPKSITVTGPEDNIAALGSITLPPINLSDIKADTEITQDISSVITKAGLSLKNPDEKTVRITVSLNLINPKDLKIPGSAISVRGLPDTKTIELPDDIIVEVSGNDNITAQMLNPAIDVTGLSDGTHEIKLNLIPPNGVALKGGETITINIKSKDTPKPTVVTTTTETTASTTEITTDKENITETQKNS